MVKFSVSIDGNAEVIRKNIETIIDNEVSYDKLVFDITIANTSKPKFKRKEGIGYRLFFTRPLFYNAFKSYVYDLNFDFIINNATPAVIEGNISIKPIVIILIIAFVSLSIMTFAFSYPGDDVLTWLFYFLIPIVLPIYFFRQVKLFKKEITKVLTVVSKEL